MLPVPPRLAFLALALFVAFTIVLYLVTHTYL